MIKIGPQNFSAALEILHHSFQNTPGVRWVVKNDMKEASRIRELCRYCLQVSKEKEGAYISSDKNGVALLFESNKRQNLINFLHGYYRLGQYCIGWDRALKIIKREQKIQSIRPKSDHLYFWMIAVKDQSHGLNTIKEIRDFSFTLAREKEHPIYAETTDENTLRLYLRYGFELYEKWETGEQGLTVYFIRRDWDIN